VKAIHTLCNASDLSVLTKEYSLYDDMDLQLSEDQGHQSTAHY